MSTFGQSALTELLRLTSRNGKNRTLKPFQGSSTKRNRSRTRLQLVLCDDWHRGAGCLVAQDLGLLTKVRTLIHEEISLLSVLYFPFRARTPSRTDWPASRNEVKPCWRRNVRHPVVW